ncbi:cell division protein FtsQ/DivIB [Flavihumibacter solisilvae]|uniref:POTRA domain-containing protein n=1 Tax=Flavihumibacter solisilvae TaxID=1349421 RepID=A0A0C1IF53_9BACT|nr:cell division protein FtsQ/DivIB [Flavihumibacter solisilvae]KIC92790.1 hypothetical protein OI18_20380 [Flavihumibacter solisilvae]
MNKRRINIRKLVAAILWLMAGVAVLVLLVAAIRSGNDANCSGVTISIKGSRKFSFLNKSDVIRLMGSETTADLKGKSTLSFDLSSMEERISANSWVADVELFFDNDRVLQVQVEEREPIARLFTRSGNSWYLDSSGKYLPLSPGKPPVKLPVFTGMPEKLKPAQVSDSTLLSHIKAISNVLYNDEFWSAQITQVDVTAGNEFELVPLVGRHIILFGNGNSCDKKFSRLAVFYRNVLAHTGFDYYSAINIKFDQQVIGVRGDAISTSVEKKIMPVTFADTSLSVISNRPAVPDPASAKSQPERKTVKDPTPVRTAAIRQPKAVMSKVNN